MMSMVYGLLLLVPNQWAFLTLFVVFPVARQFVFSTFFSFSANTFGYASFGRIAGVASTVAGLLQLSQTRLVQLVEGQQQSGGWLDWQRLDLIMGTVPVLLFLYPIISFVHEWCDARSKRDYWQPAMYADDDDSDTSALLGEERSREGSTRPILLPGAAEDDEGAGAPVQQLHMTEASSYGSQSASSFAALYSQVSALCSCVWHDRRPAPKLPPLARRGTGVSSDMACCIFIVAQYTTDDVRVAVRRTSTGKT